VKSKPLIIDTPSLQSIRLRFTSSILTLSLWVIWFYLWIPVVTLFGWWFQIETIQHEMVTMGGLQAFLNVLPTFLGITATIVFSQFLWALYNFMRFRGVDRRQPIDPVSLVDLKTTFAISDTGLNQIKKQKALTIKIDENDKIIVN